MYFLPASLNTQITSVQPLRLSFSHSISYLALGLATFLAALLLAWGASASAQGLPKEGVDYIKMAQPVPIQTAEAGKIEVIEFFWYGCPHCRELEPLLENWASKLSKDIVLKRVPVAFNKEEHEPHQRLYYVIESLVAQDTKLDEAAKQAKMNEWQGKVFNAIHIERNPLRTPDVIADWLQKQGVDRKLALDIYRSFSVASSVQRAVALAQAYKIEGVPQIAVAGRYQTSPALTNGLGATLRVADFLIDLTRVNTKTTSSAAAVKDAAKDAIKDPTKDATKETTNKDGANKARSPKEKADAKPASASAVR